MRLVTRLFFICLVLGSVGCTSLPHMVGYDTPCEYLQGMIQQVPTRTEVERLGFRGEMTLQEVISCVGEPEWTLRLVWSAWGWDYTVELWYPKQGFAIIGNTNHYVSDVRDEQGNPEWVDTTILFENPKDVIPPQLPVEVFFLTPNTNSIELFTNYRFQGLRSPEEEYLSFVRPWKGWEALEIYDPLHLLENKAP